MEGYPAWYTRLRNELERSTMLLIRVNPLFQWPCSIAFCMFTRGYGTMAVTCEKCDEKLGIYESAELRSISWGLAQGWGTGRVGNFWLQKWGTNLWNNLELKMGKVRWRVWIYKIRRVDIYVICGYVWKNEEDPRFMTTLRGKLDYKPSNLVVPLLSDKPRLGWVFFFLACQIKISVKMEIELIEIYEIPSGNLT